MAYLTFSKGFNTQGRPVVTHNSSVEYKTYVLGCDPDANLNKKPRKGKGNKLKYIDISDWNQRRHV